MLNSFRSRLKQLPSSARRYLLVAFFAMLLIALPIMVWGLVTGNFELRKRAASGEPLPPVLNPININTPNVSLHAKDHYVLANGQKYIIDTNTLTYSYDLGTENYTSLVLNWQENGKIMGIKIHFKQESTYWTVSEIITSMGSADNGLGVGQSFFGPFPIVPKGQAFNSNIDYAGSLPFGLNGLLHIEGLYINPMFIQTPVTVKKPGCSKSTIAPNSGPAPLYVTLHGGGYAKDGFGIDGYQWDFENDGYWDTNISLEPVAHIYDRPGTYYPKYRVHSPNGLWSDKCDYNYPIEVLDSQSFLQFKVKFAGVTSRPIDDSAKQIRIYGTSDNGGSVIGSANGKSNIVSVGLTVDDSGVYHGYIEPSGGSYYGYNYRLRVKGPKHLQEVFDNVVFEKGVETDLTAKPLRPGDLNQDGTLDKTDLTEVNKRIFSNKVEDIALADVNFDKRVDIIDRTLILNTLSVQYDQE